MNAENPVLKKNWPADKVERRSLDSLIPYARNSRTHSEEQVAMIAASMREWGWTNPVLIDEDGGIIAGHGRVMAARKLGISEAPVMIAAGWTEAKKRAYVIADNQLALKAGWNMEMLSSELVDLGEMDFDLGLLGFDSGEIEGLLADPPTEGLTDPDDVPEPPAEPISKLGDVWLLGRHRLVCGDCTTVESVNAALAGVKPHLMVTDPPYGVEYDPDWRVKALQGNDAKGTATGKVQNDDRADWREAWALFPGDVAYVWHADVFSPIVAASLEAAGFAGRALIVWAKSRLVIGRGDYHRMYEPCWYMVRKGKKGHWSGDRKQTNLWQIDHRKSDTGHGTQKPVECMRRPIVNNSSPGQAVYEPFSGSGTTVIACEMEGRTCHAIELDPAYVDVAVKRWQAFTGERATLEATGEPFTGGDDEVRAS